MPELERPEDPGEMPDRVMEALFREAVKDYVKETKTLKRNIKKAYELVWGQTSKMLQEKLRSTPGFKVYDKACNVIMLLRAIKAAMHRFDHRKDQYLAVAEAIGRFWILYQGKDMSNQTFYDKFKAIVSVIEEHGGNSALHTPLVALERAEHGGNEEDDKEGVFDTEELEKRS